MDPDVLALIRSCRRPPRLAGWARYLDGASFNGRSRPADTAELVYLERGRMRWRTAQVDWDIPSPALVLARPGEAELRTFIGTSRHAFLHVRLDHRALRRWRGLHAPPPLRLDTSSLVPALFRNVVDLVSGGGSALLSLTATHFLMASVLAGSSERSPRGLDELAAPVRRALLWIQRTWSTDGVRLCSLDEIASAAGCSPRHCGRLFEQHLGMQPVAAVQHLRAGLAQDLLWRTDQSVKEIAAFLGFRHPNHLSQLVLATFGLSPAGMRRAWRENREVAKLPCPPLREVLTILRPADRATDAPGADDATGGPPAVGATGHPRRR